MHADPKISNIDFSFKFTIVYKPLNTIGINIKDVSSAIANLIYISFNLYGANIYSTDANIDINSSFESSILFFNIFFIKKYIEYPVAILTTIINIFKHIVYESPKILKTSGLYAVNGL